MLAWFDRHSTNRALTENVLNDLPYAHADVVRAIEDLEKHGQSVTRRTEEGNDWIVLNR